MKAISLWQPWASLTALGFKQYETRSWPIHYRGPIAIHAAKTKVGLDVAPQTAFQLLAGAEPDYWHPDRLPYGAIVAIAQVVACFPTSLHRSNVTARERTFGDWSSGRYAWKLWHIHRLETPIPAIGKQGIWHWEPTPAIASLLAVMAKEAA